LDFRFWIGDFARHKPACLPAGRYCGPLGLGILDCPVKKFEIIHFEDYGSVSRGDN